MVTGNGRDSLAMETHDIFLGEEHLSVEFRNFISSQIPLIMRWLKRSKSGPLNTVLRIRNFTLKLYYIRLGIQLGIRMPYGYLLSHSVIKGFDLTPEMIPAFSKLGGSIVDSSDYAGRRKKKRHRSAAGQRREFDISTDEDDERNGESDPIPPIVPSDFVPTQLPNTSPNPAHIRYVARVIDQSFTNFCSRIRMTPKSKLGKPVNLTFAKLYELRMYISAFDEFLDRLFAEREIPRVSFLYNGGPPAFLFSAFHTIEKNAFRTPDMHRKVFTFEKNGIFFTPRFICKYITQKCLEYFAESPVNRKPEEGSRRIKPPLIGDPATGFGAFLEPLIFDIDSVGKYGIEISPTRIIGIDNNPSIIDIIRLNHRILEIMGKPHIPPGNFINADFLFTSLPYKFDIILGNPPWGGSFERRSFSGNKFLKKFCTGQVDSSVLFLARAIQLSRENGIIYFVMPETFLLNPNYAAIRKYLLENTEILEIIHLGEDVFGDVNLGTVLIGLRNRKPDPEHSIKIIIDIPNTAKEMMARGDFGLYELIEAAPGSGYTDAEETGHSDGTDISEEYAEEITVKFVRQSAFLTESDAVMNIFASEESGLLSAAVERGVLVPLSEIMENGRGVEIGKKGEVIRCYYCKAWLPPPKWSMDRSGVKFARCKFCRQRIEKNKVRTHDTVILPSLLKDKPEPLGKTETAFILLGEHVNKYYISGQALLKLGYKGIAYKDAEYYKSPKIVLRKTSAEITATVDYGDRYTVQVVYIFRPKEKYIGRKFITEFILGLITSEYIENWYRGKFMYFKRKSFPHHIQKNILRIPVPLIDYGNPNSPEFIYFLEISYLTLWLMLLYQIKKTGYADRKLIERLERFTEIYGTKLSKAGIDIKLAEAFPDAPAFLEQPVSSLIPPGTPESIRKMKDAAVEALYLYILEKEGISEKEDYRSA